LDLSLQPKIGDFGLAREGTESLASLPQVSRVNGTKPYLPLDFISSRQLSPKVDVYSFGVVLFELATGLRAFDGKRTEAFLKMHVTDAIDKATYNLLVDSSSPVDGYQEIFENFIRIGAECTDNSSNRRPEMKVVFEKLGACL
jgi:interleukin-1 receptor-associated kinase 1